jgi:hypothetical protein
MIWKRPAPERGAGRELALSYRSAHQQKIGYVGAGNEKNEADRAEQNEQGLTGFANHRFLQRDRAEAIQRAASARVLAAELIGDEFQLCIGLFEGHAGLETRRHQEVVGHAPRGEIELEGKPDIANRIGDEAFADDADDEVRQAVDLDRPPDNIGPPTEAALPQPIAEHDDASAVRLVFRGRERCVRRSPERRTWQSSRR